MLSSLKKFKGVVALGGILAVLYIAIVHVYFVQRSDVCTVVKAETFDMVKFFRYNHTDDFVCVNGYVRSIESVTYTDTFYFSISAKLAKQLKAPFYSDTGFIENNVEELASFFNTSKNAPNLCCKNIFNASFSDLESICENKKVKTTSKEYIEMTKNCSHFKISRGYITKPLTTFEEQFPLAYSILMYRDVEQSERLLRAIYRPQNSYCIHVDRKSAAKIYDAMTAIANCFDNVFVASGRYDVQWGTMTVLEPEILCMKELWNKNKTWKYFINLTGQEFPLRTNHELVKILAAFNGANDVEAISNG